MYYNICKLLLFYFSLLYSFTSILKNGYYNIKKDDKNN